MKAALQRHIVNLKNEVCLQQVSNKTKVTIHKKKLPSEHSDKNAETCSRELKK